MSQKKYDECDGCMYWRDVYVSGKGGEKCCHHLLDTGKRRERIGDVCLSKKEGKHKRGPNPFDIPVAQRRY